MRKAILLLIMLMSVFVFSSCNNSRFIEVQRVTFTSGGVTNTFYPEWYLIRGDFQTATIEEYGNADFKTSILAPSDVSIYSIEFYTSDLFSGIISINSSKPYKPFGITEDDVGKYLYVYAHDIGYFSESYYKTEIKGVGSHYLEVKIINDTTLVIKRGSIETTYTVTMYSIVE